MTATPDLLEIETSEMTKNYRASRHELWKQLQTRHQENRDRALQHGATPQQATEYANKFSRGEVGVFVWELLTRAHRDAAALFFERAPVSWAVQAEVLLTSPEVPTLRAMRLGVTQPLPMLLQAPSPTAGYHLALARAGQRCAHSGRRSGRASSRSISGGRSAGESWKKLRSGVSQSAVCWFRRLVPEAIATLVARRPVSLARR